MRSYVAQKVGALMNNPNVRKALSAAGPAASRAAAHGAKEFARKFAQEYTRERKKL